MTLLFLKRAHEMNSHMLAHLPDLLEMLCAFVSVGASGSFLVLVSGRKVSAFSPSRASQS